MNILLIGYGSMGSALLKGWLKKQVPYEFSVATPHEISVTSLDPNLPWFKNAEAVQGHFDAVVLAIKPKITPMILQEYKHIFDQHPLVITLVAGRKIDTYYDVLSPQTPIVRIMPNLAVADGVGMTFLCTHSNLSPAHKDTVETLTQAVGKCLWIEEDHMNAATALASCGPGFIFELTHQLGEIGMALGLPKDIAQISARQMIIGSGAHLKHTNLPPQELAANVGPPGSMTESGIKILKDKNALHDLFLHTLQASIRRGEEL